MYYFVVVHYYYYYYDFLALCLILNIFYMILSPSLKSSIPHIIMNSLAEMRAGREVCSIVVCVPWSALDDLRVATRVDEGRQHSIA